MGRASRTLASGVPEPGAQSAGTGEPLRLDGMGPETPRSPHCPAVQTAAAVRLCLSTRSGHNTLAEGETSLVWGPGCLCPLDLLTLHLGSLEGTSPYAPPRPGQRGQGREAPVDTLPGPSLPTRNCTSARRRWLVLACLLFFKQEMPGCPSQGLCSEPDSADGSVCLEQVGAGRLGGLPGTFPGSCLNLCSSSPK